MTGYGECVTQVVRDVEEPSATNPRHSCLHPSIFSRRSFRRRTLRIQRMSVSSESQRKNDESLDKMDSNPASGDAKASAKWLISIKNGACMARECGTSEAPDHSNRRELDKGDALAEKPIPKAELGAERDRIGKECDVPLGGVRRA